MHRPLRIAALLGVLALGAVPLTAQARAGRDEPMLQYEMGFLGGQRTLTEDDFVLASGDVGAVPLAAGLVQPFGGAPFVRARLLGPSVETRVVVHHLRVGVGVAKPFLTFPLSAGVTTDTETGSPQAVSVRSISEWDLRFVLGAEASLGPVTPFLDLVGTTSLTTVDLAFAGTPLQYRAWGFDLAARAGVRVAVGKTLYVSADGQLGLTGGWPWAAHLCVGWSLD